MKHTLIKTENYLLVVSDDEIKEGDYALLNKKTHLEIQKALPSCLKNAFKNAECWNVENRVHEAGHKKIIAHLPLNEAPYLDGVDVLLEIEDDINNRLGEACDLLKAMLSESPPSKEFVDDQIKSLKQLKLPIAFECGMEVKKIENAAEVLNVSIPKTTTNSEGRTEWVGKYLF